MTRLKRLIPALLCASLSVGSLYAAEWTSARLQLAPPFMQVGYFDQARRNTSIEGNPATIAGVRYADAIGMHANAEFTLTLDGKAVKATGAVGIDDETNGRGSVNFQWFDASSGNRKLLWESGEMKPGEKAKEFSINLNGITRLQFVAAQGSDMDYDHADLVNFKVEYDGAEPVQQSMQAPAFQTNHLTWNFTGNVGNELRQGVFGAAPVTAAPAQGGRQGGRPGGFGGFGGRGFGGGGQAAVAAWPRLPSEVMEPSVYIIQEDGTHNLELRLQQKDVVALDDERTQSTFVLKDPLYPVTVTLIATAFKTADVFTSQIIVKNNGEKNITLLDRDAAFINLPFSNETYLTSFYGDWGREMTEIHEDKVGRGVLKHLTNKGSRVAVPDYPGCYISFDGKLEEEKGRVFAAAIAWSGSWEYSITTTQNNTVFFAAGVPGTPTILKPGEDYNSPKIVMTFSNEGAGQASRNLHNYGRMYGVYNGDKQRPVVLNSWEGTYMDFNEAKLDTYIPDAAKLGVEYFVLDDGWFGNKYPRNNDTQGLGDWMVNKAKLPSGIEHLCDLCEQNGIKFGIWVEPEMVCPKSELFDAHPEYATELKGRNVQLIRNQRVLDLANPVVEEYVYKCVADLLKEHPRIAYIKWDHNCTLGANPGSHVDLDNQGSFSDKYTEAYYRIMEKLRKNFPNVIFQACGSGGMRGDIGALQYSEEIWGSDQTNGINRISIQWGWSHFLPVKAVAAHVGCLNEGDYKFRTDVAMTARMGVELDPSSGGARRIGDPAIIAKGIAVYKQLRPLLHSADLYRGRSPMVSQTTELTFVSQDKSEAVFFGFKRNRGARTETIKASGLDPNAKYKLTELNTDTEPRIEAGQTLTGAQLMQNGVQVKFPDKVSSVNIKLDKVQ